MCLTGSIFIDIVEGARGWVFSTVINCLVVLVLTALLRSISVFFGSSPREREKEKRNDRQEKNI